MRPGGAGELTGEQADGLRELVELYAPLKEGIGRVGRLAKSNAAWETLRQLSLTAGLLESFGLEERVRLDFSLVNSMDYYNGVIFQGFLPASTPRCSPAGGTTTCPVRWQGRWGHRLCPVHGLAGGKGGRRTV